MMVLWEASFDTGIADVDSDHRRLVSLINELDEILSHTGDLGRIGGVIDALVDYTDYHFHREERLLEQVGYADAKVHAEIHAQFGHFLGEMIGACMLSPSLEMARELHTYLCSWLVDHILAEDMKYVPAILEKGVSL